MTATVDTVLQGMHVPGMARVYVLGSLERRVTVYSQQVRALNLVHALFERGELGPDTNLAVVGAGAAGLTCAAAALHRGARVTVLEKCRQLLPIFRRARPEQPVNRWLHPRVYDWPQPGWNGSRAGLPLLDWLAGSVAEVAETLLAGWEDIARQHDERLTVHCDVERIRIDRLRETSVRLTYVKPADTGRQNTRDTFDALVLAVGFGLEQYERASERSYWDPDDLDSSEGFRPGVDQPRTWLVSGAGDGGLTDLLRLRIDRFRHVEMLTRLLPADAEELEARIREIEDDPRARGPDAAEFLTDAYEQLDGSVVADVGTRMGASLRGDTAVTFNSPDGDYLRPEASALNRFLTCQLNRAGGFALEPGRIESVADTDDGRVRVRFARGNEETYDRIVRRHGPRPAALSDFPQVWAKLQPLREVWQTRPQLLDQTRARIWPEGEFGPEERPQRAPTRPARAPTGTHADAADEDALAVAEQCYRDAVIREYQTLRVSLASVGKVDIPLEEIFVDLHCVGEIPDAADAFSADERRLLAEFELADEPTRHELLGLLDDRRYQRWRQLQAEAAPLWQRQSIVESLAGRTAPLVLLGDPGSGKSTLLQLLALRAASGQLDSAFAGASGGELEQAPPLLPILVRLAAFDEYLDKVESHTPLAEFLPLYWTRCLGVDIADLAGLFRQALDEGRALVLLDGLDEVLTRSRRRSVVGQVQRFIAAHGGRGNRFVVTSRVIGYRDEPLPRDAYEHATVLDLDKSDIATLVRRWSRALEAFSARTPVTVDIGRRADQLSERVLGEFEGKPHLAQLAVNPLMASMLVRLARARNARLPAQRVLLYREFTNLLLEQWPDERSHDARQGEVAATPLPRLQLHLMDLALYLHRKYPSGTAPRRVLEAALTESCLPFLCNAAPTDASPAESAEAESAARSLLDELRSRLGIIAERGPDAFGFLHLSHQEYFAAGALARMRTHEARWQVLAEHLHDPRWREVLLFCAGWLGHVHLRTDDVDALVRAILAVDSPYEDLLHRDVFLAADLVADEVGASMAVIGEVSAALRELLDAPLGQVRRRAMERFVALVELGHQPTIEHVLARFGDADPPRPFGFDTMRKLATMFDKPGCQALREYFLDELNGFDWHRENWLVWNRLQWVIPVLARADADLRATLCDRLRSPVHGEQLASHLCGLVPEFPELLDHLLPYFRQRGPRSLWINLLLVAPNDVRVQALADERWRNRRQHRGWQYDLTTVAVRLAGQDARWRRRVLDEMSGADADLQVRLLGNLGDLAHRDDEIRERIVQVTESESLARQRAAFSALARSARTHHDARSALTPALAHDDSSIRLNAVRALGSMAPYSTSICAHLQERLDDPRAAVRDATLNALAPLASDQPELRERLQRLLQIQATAPANVCIDTVAPLLTRSDALYTHLVRYLDDRDTHTRVAAMQALAPLFEEDQTLHLRIVPKLASQYDSEAECAIELLAPWAQQPAIRSRLMVCLDNRRVRLTAARVLAERASDAPDVVKAFRALAARLEHDAQLGDHDALVTLEPMLGQDPIVTDKVLTYCMPRFSHGNILAILARHPDLPGVRERLSSLTGQGLLTQLSSHALRGLWKLIGGERMALDGALLAARQGDRRALEFVAAHASTHQQVREFLCETLENEPTQNLLQTLQPLVADHPRVRAAFEAVFHSRAINSPRSIVPTVISGLASALSQRPELAEQLLPWLGMRTDERQNRTTPLRGIGMPIEQRNQSLPPRKILALAYADILRPDTPLWTTLEAQLDSDAWQARQGAVWTFAAWDGDLPAPLMDRLLATLDDRRAEESWLQRLQAAECFLNHRDPALSREAIAIAEQALQFGQEPWHLQLGSQIRKQAARILAKLEPTVPDQRLLDLVATRLREESDQAVKEDLYQTLLALATIPSDRLSPTPP